MIIIKKSVKYTLDPAKPLPLTKKQKAEIKALAEMPDSTIDYSDIPSPTEGLQRAKGFGMFSETKSVGISKAN